MRGQVFNYIEVSILLLILYPRFYLRTTSVVSTVLKTINMPEAETVRFALVAAKTTAVLNQLSSDKHSIRSFTGQMRENLVPTPYRMIIHVDRTSSSEQV